MRMIGSLPSLRSSRNPLVFLGFLGAVVFAGYQAAQLVLAGDVSGLMFVALIGAGGAVTIAILNDWHRGLYFLIAWIAFEDLVRKFLGNNMVIYFGKDILAVILYLALFRAYLAKSIPRFRPPFRILLLTFIWFGAIQVFNPASNSIFLGLLGMKVYFLYVPLMFVGYALIETEEDLRRFLAFHCVIILLVAGLGLIQSVLGPSFLNPAVMQEDIRELSTAYRGAPISGLRAYRPVSVFVSAGRFQDFLIFSWLIALGNAGYLLLRSKKGRTLAFLTVGVVAAASFMSASRSVFMINAINTVIVVVGFLWGAPWRQGEALRVVRTIQRSVLIVVLGLFALLALFPEDVGSRVAVYTETLLPDSPSSELVQRTQTYPLIQLGYAFDHPLWPYGYGMGTCTLGGQYVTRILHIPWMGLGVENGYGNIMIELGIVGLLLWIALGVSISVSAWKVVNELKGTPWFPISFVILIYVAQLFFPITFLGSSTFQDFVVSSCLWLYLGILFRVQDVSRTLLNPEVRSVSRQA